MSSELNIRRVLPTDLDAVLAIERQSFGSEAFRASQFKYLSKTPSCIFVVATVSSVVAGYLILLTRSNSKRLRIYSIATDRNYRGKGIGQGFIGFAKATAKELGLLQIGLEVREDNHPAIALYSKEGFVPRGRKLHYYGQNQHALVMVYDSWASFKKDCARDPESTINANLVSLKMTRLNEK